LRPMTAADADGVYLTSSEAMPATAEERQQVMSRSAEEVARRKERYLHFVEHDSRGAWVAVNGDRVVGVALALVREAYGCSPSSRSQKSTATMGWETSCSTVPSSTPKDAAVP
jgi:hypothetical protein